VAGATNRDASTFLVGPRVGVTVPVGLSESLRLSLDLIADAPRPAVRAGGIADPLWEAAPLAAVVRASIAFQIP
jgi:hypothetical protein